MKKNITIISCAIICCILSLIFFSILVYIYPIDHTTFPPPLSISLNQTQIEDGYTLTIKGTTPNQIKTSNLVWWITNQSGITYFKNTFPNLNGKEGSSVDDNITVTWFDNDNDGKLSKNDLIQIKSPFKDLIGFEFRILEKHDEGYTEISIIELN